MPLETNDPNEMELGLVSSAREELQKAIGRFKENYERFAKKYKLPLTDNDGFRQAIQEADKLTDIRVSARFFGTKISNVLQITQDKKKASDAKWTGVVSNFLSKFYPLARLSLRLVGTLADVCLPVPHLLIPKGSTFLPLKGIADGLVMIMEVCFPILSFSSQDTQRGACSPWRLLHSIGDDSIPGG
jgi:hypothetical protein